MVRQNLTAFKRLFTLFFPDILIPQVKTEVEAIVGEDGLERERVDGSAVLSTVA